MQLKILLGELVNLFDKLDIPCIIMHGSLIGWYFGNKILPWDDDIDIVILDEHREKLKTLSGYQNNNILFEVNPVIDTIKRDPFNIIEARIICKKTGCFIDITNLSKGNIFNIGNSKSNVKTKTFDLYNNYTNEDNFLFKEVPHKYKDKFNITFKLLNKNKLEIKVKRLDSEKGWNLDLTLYGYDGLLYPLYNKNKVNCFSPHYYNIADIYPLKKSIFESVNVYVPNNVENVLISEYGCNVLKPHYLNYKYLDGDWYM